MLDLIYRGKVVSVEGESLTVQLTSTVRSSVECVGLLVLTDLTRKLSYVPLLYHNFIRIVT